MKTNKSFTKRLRVTKNKKVVARKGGQNHFRAKQSRQSQLSHKRTTGMYLTNKAKRRFLINSLHAK